MTQKSEVAVLRQRRDNIREWLDEEAPYTEVDQRHLDAHTPERAYWHHGYQAALSDILDLLTPAGRISGSAGTPK